MFTKNNKYSTVYKSYSTRPNKYVTKINTYLQSKGYEIIKKEDISKEFIQALTDIFRPMTSPYYSPSLFPIIKTQLNKFKEDFKAEWKHFLILKQRILGSKLLCLRFISLSHGTQMLMTDGSYKLLQDITPEDRFYYPINKRDFSQWAELDSEDDINTSKFNNVSSDTEEAFISEIPTGKIVFNNRVFGYGFSPRVLEDEVIVEHNINEQWDKSIICKFIKTD